MSALTVDGVENDSSQSTRHCGRIFRSETSFSLQHRGFSPLNKDLCSDRPTQLLEGAGSRAISEKIDIGLCCSGGGIRAAAFVLGSLMALRKRNLLGKISMMSSVSGGGFTASAFYTHIAALASANDLNDNDAAAAAPPSIRRITSFSRDQILADALDNLHEQMQKNHNYIGRKFSKLKILFHVFLNICFGNLMLFVTAMVPLGLLVENFLGSEEASVVFDSANPLDETSTSLLNTAIVLSCGAILFFLLASLLRWFRPARPSGGRSASLARLMGFLIFLLSCPILGTYVLGMLFALGREDGVKTLSYMWRVFWGFLFSLGLASSLANASWFQVNLIQLPGVALILATSFTWRAMFISNWEDTLTGKIVWTVVFAICFVYNLTSRGLWMHRFYAQSIRDAFFAKSVKNESIGDIGEKVKSVRGPGLLICAAINGLNATEAMPSQVASFTFSSRYIGSDAIGFHSRNTKLFKLYKATALSGAAIATHVGRNQAAQHVVSATKIIFTGLGFSMADYAAVQLHSRVHRLIPIGLSSAAAVLLVLSVWIHAWFAVISYCILFLMLIVLTINVVPKLFAWKPGAIFLDFLSIPQISNPLPPHLRITDGGHFENNAVFQQLSLPKGKRLKHIIVLDSGYDKPSKANGYMWECADLYFIMSTFATRNFQFEQINDDKFGPRLFPSKGQTTVRPFLTIKVTYPEGDTSMLYYIHMDDVAKEDLLSAAKDIDDTVAKGENIDDCLPSETDPWTSTSNQFISAQQFRLAKLTGYCNTMMMLDNEFGENQRRMKSESYNQDYNTNDNDEKPALIKTKTKSKRRKKVKTNNE